MGTIARNVAWLEMFIRRYMVGCCGVWMLHCTFGGLLQALHHLRGLFVRSALRCYVSAVLREPTVQGAHLERNDERGESFRCEDINDVK